MGLLDDWDPFSEDSLLGFLAGDKKDNSPGIDWGSAAREIERKTKWRNAALAKKLPRLLDKEKAAREEVLEAGDVDTYIRLTFNWVEGIRKLKLKYGVYYVIERELEYSWLDDVIEHAAQASEQTIRELIKLTGWLYLKERRLRHNYRITRGREARHWSGTRHHAFESEWLDLYGIYSNSNLLSLAEAVDKSSRLTSVAKEKLLDRIITIFAKQKSRLIKWWAVELLWEWGSDDSEFYPQHPKFWSEEIIPIAAKGASLTMTIKILLACEQMELNEQVEKVGNILRENHPESYEETLRLARLKYKKKVLFFFLRSESRYFLYPSLRLIKLSEGELREISRKGINRRYG